MPLGPVMLDIEGHELTTEERQLLKLPQVGGVILFTRNYQNPKQLTELVTEIRQCRNPLLIAVDQEGGRVQRFREGFTELPPLSVFGELYQHDPEKSLQLAESTAWLMASELLAIGVDLSFAPVLDINIGVSSVIGNRSFSNNIDIIKALAIRYVQGMHRAGMAAVGKHFPGHGSVAADSHIDMPIDERPLETIEQLDLQPFAELAKANIDAFMPAHVIYQQIDKLPACFSSRWLQEILREQLGFNGVVFSDDLCMAGADCIGNYPQRAQQALQAGCDMVLVCNNRPAALEVLDAVANYSNPQAEQRLLTMLGKPQLSRPELMNTIVWQQAVQQLSELGDQHVVS